MRLWHYKLLPYLPDLQLKGQLRELVAIMHMWRDEGTPRHMLVNNILNYDKAELYQYFLIFEKAYDERFRKTFNAKYKKEFIEFCGENCTHRDSIFSGWHDKRYLRVCMANLYEKHRFAYMSKSKVDISEWQRLCEGYRYITGEDYEI